MIHARLIAGVRGLDSGAIFAEGQQLDAKRAGRVSAKQIGRMLPLKEAKQILRRLDG